MYIHVYIYVYIEIPQVLKETLQGKHSLLAAAAVGNVQAVSEHIAKGADLRARNLHGRTALMLACLSAKKKRKTKDDEEEDEEDDEKSGGDDDEGEEGGGDDDDEEMRKQQAEEVAALLITPTGAAGALDAVDNDGMSSLMAARKNGLDDIVKMLLKAGADINTSIHSAAYNGHTESITALLQGGAAVDAKLEVRGALLSFMSRALALLLSLSSVALFLGFISSIHAYVGSRLCGVMITGPFIKKLLHNHFITQKN